VLELERQRAREREERLKKLEEREQLAVETVAKLKEERAHKRKLSASNNN